MRIAIVDDNKNDREMVLDFLRQYFEETNETYSTVVFEDAMSFLQDYSGIKIYMIHQKYTLVKALHLLNMLF